MDNWKNDRFQHELYKFKLHLISFLHKIVKYIIGINSSGIEIWKPHVKLIP